MRGWKTRPRLKSDGAKSLIGEKEANVERRERRCVSMADSGRSSKTVHERTRKAERRSNRGVREAKSETGWECRGIIKQTSTVHSAQATARCPLNAAQSRTQQVLFECGTGTPGTGTAARTGCSSESGTAVERAARARRDGQGSRKPRDGSGQGRTRPTMKARAMRTGRDENRRLDRQSLLQLGRPGEERNTFHPESRRPGAQSPKIATRTDLVPFAAAPSCSAAAPLSASSSCVLRPR